MRTERSDVTEPLMPVYSDQGDIIAFERSVDPRETVRLNRDTHLAKMIGVWRGRQVEEYKGIMFNEVLVDRLFEMHQEDIVNVMENMLIFSMKSILILIR